jgi:hypothetical protein
MPANGLELSISYPVVSLNPNSLARVWAHVFVVDLHVLSFLDMRGETRRNAHNRQRPGEGLGGFRVLGWELQAGFGPSTVRRFNKMRNAALNRTALSAIITLCDYLLSLRARGFIARGQQTQCQMTTRFTPSRHSPSMPRFR